MEPLVLPQFVEAGSLTFETDSSVVRFTSDAQGSLALNNGTDLLLLNNSDTVALNTYDVSPNITIGSDLIINGHPGVFTVATSAVDNQFTLEEVWEDTISTFSALVLNNGTDLLLLNNGTDGIELNSGSADGYIPTTKLLNDALGAATQVNAIGLFSGRTSYDGEDIGFAYLSLDGGGSETIPKIYVRQASSWANYEDIYLYVDASTGDDDDDGLLDTTALATISQALIRAQEFGDITHNTLTIQVASGTYDENLILPEMVGFTDVGQLRIVFEDGAELAPSDGIAVYAKDIKAVWKLVDVDFT